MPLIKAHQMMREFNIRHLPVLDGGKVVGLLSQRDLALVESLKDVNPEVVKVEEACSEEPYQVAPLTSLKEVSENLAENRYGCAVVVENHKVVGVFTTEDAIMALTTFIK